jgi:hypothetical protein
VCFDPTLLDDPILVESQLEPAGPMILTRSTVSRELVFVISHTIHHNAIIGQVLTAQGITLEPRYGMAPSTPVDGDGTRLASAREVVSCAP